MVKLTEEMVVARTRISDFSAVKKLNCWGTELTDVSILRRMKNVEVLSLSINNINTLADFQYCHKLQDLFIRRNNIKDLNEICYLQGLPNLRNLWLGENPCAEKEGYRLSVLRTLPNLEKLDDKGVSPEEIQTAMAIGRPLVHPLEMDTSPQSDAVSPDRSFDETQQSHEEYDPDRRNANYSASSSHHYSQNNQYAYELQNGQSKKHSKDDTVRTELRSNNETAATNTLEISKDYDERPVVSRHNGDYDERRGYSDYSGNEVSQRVYTSTPQHRTQYVANESADDRRSERNNSYDYDDRIKLEYEDSQSQLSQQTRRMAINNVEREDTSQVPGWVKHTDKDKCRSQFHYHRRPVTRNSNILSAVLCLVKELDYPSLEVVEMAVRNRMDELEE
ncbi:cilia- and flagella-associated protein 410 isoform X2 [Odontomachus brunneus]|uniref:cilia- and flagella-associated protein 410 isoform X2 n=1 Tax=Odontomachus brunneus TaxID=486640 RepID=UPI0013F1FF31|nr:cilia- and flagella-associated protein 410 isoform X2 [Odontomachus brunneus]